MFFQQMQKWKTIFQIYCAMHFLGPAKKNPR